MERLEQLVQLGQEVQQEPLGPLVQLEHLAQLEPPEQEVQQEPLEPLAYAVVER